MTWAVDNGFVDGEREQFVVLVCGLLLIACVSRILTFL